MISPSFSPYARAAAVSGACPPDAAAGRNLAAPPAGMSQDAVQLGADAPGNESAESAGLQAPERPERGQPPERPERGQAPERPERGRAYTLASQAVGAVAGFSLGLTRLVVGGCAGGAQGLVRAVDLKDEQARTAFTVTMGANLAVTGALAGGVAGLDFLALTPAEGAVAGAATNVLLGIGEWNRSDEAFHQSITGAADRWVQSAVDRIPPFQTPVLNTVTRGAVGEVVGLAAGTVAAASQLPTHFREGYRWGVEAFDGAAAWVARRPEAAS